LASTLPLKVTRIPQIKETGSSVQGGRQSQGTKLEISPTHVGEDYSQTSIGTESPFKGARMIPTFHQATAIIEIKDDRVTTMNSPRGALGAEKSPINLIGGDKNSPWTTSVKHKAEPSLLHPQPIVLIEKTPQIFFKNLT